MFVRVIGSVVLGAALLVLGAGNAFAVKPKDLVGTYDAVSTTSGGKKIYSTVEITFEKGRTVKLTWRYSNSKRRDIAMGQLRGNKLNVTYTRAVVQTQGTAVYTVENDGSLVGRWEETNARTGALSGTETLTPKK